MMTKFSLWGVYFASYWIDYVLILVVLICKLINKKNETGILDQSLMLFVGFLALFIIISLAIAICVRNMKSNTRIHLIPEKNITHEIMGYIFAYVVSIMSAILGDWWILSNVLLFVLVGLFFVKSNRVFISPLFVFPLGYTILESGENVIITNYSLQEMRLAQEDSLEGLEARELTERVFLVRKTSRKSHSN